MINTRAPPRPTPSMVNYSDEDSAKGYDENPDDSDSLTEKPSEISSTDSQDTGSEQDSRESEDPHSFVNHYANVNNTFRQSWKRQKPIQTSVNTAASPVKSTLSRHQNPGGSSSNGGAIPRTTDRSGGGISNAGGNNGARGYSSFTESSDQDGNSAVVSLNGTQLVMNNKARSRAPLPGFSSFVWKILLETFSAKF